MSEYALFTSESVSEGHPDKIADQISDAVLDAIITQDKHARVAVETLVKTGVAVVAGEVTTSAWVDLEELVRKVILDIGYDSSEVGFDQEDLARWADAAGLTPGESLYVGLKNGFQIQVRHFAKPDAKQTQV